MPIHSRQILMAFVRTACSCPEKAPYRHMPVDRNSRRIDIRPEGFFFILTPEDDNYARAEGSVPGKGLRLRKDLKACEHIKLASTDRLENT